MTRLRRHTEEAKLQPQTIRNTALEGSGRSVTRWGRLVLCSLYRRLDSPQNHSE
jgi:hypothetical protein